MKENALKFSNIKIGKNEKNFKTTKFTRLVKNFKGFFNKKKKLTSKKKNNLNGLNESDFFKTLKEMMIISLTKEDIIKYFKKDKQLRAEIETRTVADFLTSDNKNIFLNRIKKISKDKLYSLVQCLNLEYYKKDDLIFLYKEPLNKFYIIFEGIIALSLPYFTKKNITIKDFLNYLFYIKKYCPKSFIRVEKKNENLFDGIYKLKLNEYNINCLPEYDEKKKRDFFIEEYQNVYNINEGNQVNQISILYNLVQNFNGYAKTDIYLLSLNRTDFMNILRIIVEEDLSKEFAKLRKYCYIFSLWSNYSLAQITSYYIPFKYINGEILYKQREDSDSFYIIQEGLFEVYCDISLSEYSQYKKYVLKENKNIIEWIKEQKEKKIKISIEKIIDYIQWKIRKEEYPKEKKIIDKNNIYIQKKLLNKIEENKENLINLKVNEEILKDKNKNIRIKLFTLQKNDYIGLEDSLELKSRFYHVKCVSRKGILNKIRVLDFILFISSNHGLELQNINDYVKERKKTIIDRIYQILNRELNNNKNNIYNAYNLALSSYEKRKNQAIKIKKDNIFNINYMNNLNSNNKKIIHKMEQMNQNSQKMNCFIQYKNINLKRKKSSGIRKYYLLNQLINNNQPKTSLHKLKWNFNEENEKSNISNKNRNKTQTNLSTYILTTSHTERKNKIKNIDKIKNLFYIRTNTYSNINIKKQSKEIIKKCNLTTTNFFYKNYDLKNIKDSPYNLKYEKEILSMTGIYNTKREKTKKKLIFSFSKDKVKKRIYYNYKLSHNITNKKKKKDSPTQSLLSINNINGELILKNTIKKNIPYLKRNIKN